MCFLKRCHKNMANKGIKISICNHIFIVISGRQLYYIYKRYKESVVRIGNIIC